VTAIVTVSTITWDAASTSFDIVNADVYIAVRVPSPYDVGSPTDL